MAKSFAICDSTKDKVKREVSNSLSMNDFRSHPILPNQSLTSASSLRQSHVLLATVCKLISHVLSRNRASLGSARQSRRFATRAEF